ncbi:hypothetical protein O181_112209 [Austropuccinia psidii MF-1]|uniref:Uncharacterized protein n=1 Tax=Austropuccinia psidii MF-1 TaxID=1389203 RepID=A0A9Q3PSI8_9BASI|nr:hypothetical protein [Austropuccinia psidii MF-1]
MSYNNPVYSSTFLKAIELFTIEEFEELVFCTPLMPIKRLMWDSTRASSPEEEPLSTALAFYTFINGDYLPKLFVDDPKTFFSIGPASNSQGSKNPAPHTYELRPRGPDGCEITSHSK